MLLIFAACITARFCSFLQLVWQLNVAHFVSSFVRSLFSLFLLAFAARLMAPFCSVLSSSLSLVSQLDFARYSPLLSSILLVFLPVLLVFAALFLPRFCSVSLLAFTWFRVRCWARFCSTVLSSLLNSVLLVFKPVFAWFLALFLALFLAPFLLGFVAWFCSVFSPFSLDFKLGFARFEACCWAQFCSSVSSSLLSSVLLVFKPVLVRFFKSVL